MRSLIFLLISAVFLTAACCGCSSIKVKRTDTSKTVDLSGGWNDSDSPNDGRRDDRRLPSAPVAERF